MFKFPIDPENESVPRTLVLAVFAERDSHGRCAPELCLIMNVTVTLVNPVSFIVPI